MSERSKLTEPMKLVINILANHGDPRTAFTTGQLRMIYQGLVNRDLIRRVGEREFVLTPAGRNYITHSRKFDATVTTRMKEE